jgi:hypothetical protein
MEPGKAEAPKSEGPTEKSPMERKIDNLTDLVQTLIGRISDLGQRLQVVENQQEAQRPSQSEGEVTERDNRGKKGKTREEREERPEVPERDAGGSTTEDPPALQGEPDDKGSPDRAKAMRLFGERALRFKPTLSSSQIKSHGAVFEKQFGGYHESQSGPVVHPLGAALREVATVKMLACLAQAGTKHVLSKFGAKRDRKLLDYLQKQGKVMDLTVLTHQIVASDIRRQVEEELDPAAVYDGAMLVDVFLTKDDFTDVLQECFDQGARKVVWTGFQFNGWMDAEAEGAWVRTGDEVIFRPDPNSEAYPQHDAMDFLWDSRSCILPGGDRVVWTELFAMPSAGVHTARKVLVFERNDLVASDPPLRRPGLVERMEFGQPPIYRGWAGSLRYGLDAAMAFCRFRSEPRKAVGLVHGGAKTKASGDLAAREMSMHTFRAVMLSVNRAIEDCSRFTRVSSLFPYHKQRVVEDTAHFVFFGDIERRRHASRSLSLNYSRDCSDYNLALRSVADDREFPLWRYVAAGAVVVSLGLIGWYRYRSVKPVTLGHGCGLFLDMVRDGAASFVGAGSRVLETTRSHLGGLGLAEIQRDVSRVSELVTDLLDRFGLGFLQSPSVQRLPFHWSVPLVLSPVVEEVIIRATGWLGAIALTAGDVATSTVVNKAVDPMSHVSGVLAGPCILHGLSAALSKGPLWTLPLLVVGHGLFNLAQLRAYVQRSQANLASGWWLALAALGIPLLVAAFCRRQPRVTTPWSQFRAVAYSGPFPREEVEAPVHVSNFPPEEAWVPVEQDPAWPTPVQCTLLRVRGTFVENIVKARNSTFFYLPTSVPVLRFCQSYGCVRTGFLTRIGAAPVQAPGVQFENWRGVPEILDGFMEVEITWDHHIQEWIDNYADGPAYRYKRAVRVYLRYYAEGVVSSSTTVPVRIKPNEVLPFRLQGAKPRTVQPVPTIVQVIVGPFLLEATRRFKRLLCAEAPAMIELSHGQRLMMRYCSSASDHDLTMWREQFESLLGDGDFGVFVAGDDVWLLRRKGTELREYEFDASRFDQGLSKGPLFYEYRILRQLGVPESITNLLWKVACSPLVFSSLDKVVVDRSKRPFRDSGAPDTTLGNGIVMLAIVARVVDTYTGGRFDEHFRKQVHHLGWKVTGGEVVYGTGSFLTGLWYPTNKGLIWGPVPSLIIKTGKSLEDPRRLAGTKDLAVAARYHASCVASTYASFLQVPILRAYVERFYEGERPNVDPDRAYKIRSTGLFSGTQVVESEALHLIYLRYGVSSEEVAQVEDMYRNAKIFSFLQHPAFRELSKVDYGE